MSYEADSLFDLPPQPPHEHVYSVSELTLELKDLLEENYDAVIVEGEISGWKVYSSGHAYFSLKDEDAVLSGVMWRTSLARHRDVDIQNGMAVRAEGRISLYPPRGQYQLIVEKLRPAGQGLLQQRFEELKKQLAEEGLFDEDRKKPLPFLPRNIGLVTSPTGAAIQDFLKVVREARLPLEIIHTPCRVQGTEAPGEVARAIGALNERPGIEMIVVTRGGGSLEDLWAFNEEIVARAIADSEVPVLSAVGHEVDFTIADFVADVRAPTPTGAALLLTGIYETQRNRLARLLEGVSRAKRRHLEAERARLVALYRALSRYHPRRVVDERRRQLDEISDALRQRLSRRIEQHQSGLLHAQTRLGHAVEAHRASNHQRLERSAERLSRRGWEAVRSQRARLERLCAALQELDPHRILTRGFAITEQLESGDAVTSSRAVSPGDRLRIRFSDGAVIGKVEDVEHGTEAP